MAEQPSFQTLLDSTVRFYRDEMIRQIEQPLWGIFSSRDGWPRRFHPFPQLDRLNYQYREFKYRVTLAVEVLCGRHECDG